MPLPIALRRAATVTAGLAATGVGCLAYARFYEVDAYRLRRLDVPILPQGAEPVRILQVTDIHMTPANRKRQEWISKLAGLEPDLVINTGDNLAHAEAAPYVLRSLGRLLDRPGVFVWGSNDYHAPGFRNPLKYFAGPSKFGSGKQTELPWQDLEAGFVKHGWTDLTHRRAVIEVKGLRLGFRGTDDAHLNRDDYAQIAGPIDRDVVDVALGVTHAPYRRVLDAMTYDGHDMIVAGHTHGGQICLPGYGTLVSNCDLPTKQAKGLSHHSAGGRSAWLHVSAGLGTSPYTPIRFACPPEATLMTLVPAAR